jgi:hypothetical protein
LRSPPRHSAARPHTRWAVWERATAPRRPDSPNGHPPTGEGHQAGLSAARSGLYYTKGLYGYSLQPVYIMYMMKELINLLDQADRIEITRENVHTLVKIKLVISERPGEPPLYDEQMYTLHPGESITVKTTADVEILVDYHLAETTLLAAACAASAPPTPALAGSPVSPSAGPLALSVRAIRWRWTSGKTGASAARPESHPSCDRG